MHGNLFGPSWGPLTIAYLCIMENACYCDTSYALSVSLNSPAHCLFPSISRPQYQRRNYFTPLCRKSWKGSPVTPPQTPHLWSNGKKETCLTHQHSSQKHPLIKILLSLTGLLSIPMWTCTLIPLRLILSSTLAPLQPGHLSLPSLPCHANYMIVPKWKHMSMTIPLLSHQKDLTLL